MRTTIVISVEIDRDAYLEEYGLDDNADPGEYAAYTIGDAAQARLAAIGGWAKIVTLTTAAAPPGREHPLTITFE